MENQLFVVGIGASAGGLRALEEFFDYMPSDSGAAFVVVQHLSPDFKSLMKELLERRTNMAVHRVAEKMPLISNQVYLIPPRHTLEIRQGEIHLTAQLKDVRSQPHHPIDKFFESLAEHSGERAIGIVLSGTGRDGSLGLQTIHEAGGLTLVQSPATAEFQAMPQNALDTGHIDQAMPPGELAAFIYEFIKQGQQRQSSLFSPTSTILTDEQLQTILQILADSENLDFSYYKSSTINRRTALRCSLTGYSNVDEYIEFLQGSPEEQRQLISDLLIGVTRFFRDPDAWLVLEQTILPDLITRISSDRPVFRAWVAACSTGEEAYSLAMMIDQVMGKLGKRFPIKLFATDVDTEALQKAGEGSYPESIAGQVPQSFLRQYFTWQNGRFHVKRSLRESIIFAPHDLTKNIGFTNMHLISCRNVLIYMRPSQQQQVLRTLHFSLASKGVVFLGECEQLGDIQDEFVPLSNKWKFFQKRRDVRLPPLQNSRNAVLIPVGVTASRISPNRTNQKVVKSPLNPLLQQALVNVYASRNATCVLLDNQSNLMHTVVDAARLLTVPQGEITQQITAMLPAALRVPVSTALSRARHRRESVTYVDIAITTAECDRSIQITATYTEEQLDFQDFFTLVLEETPVASAPSQPANVLPLSEHTNQRVIELENELQQTKAHLQSTIEELETTNEEQQATNEELLASNEELQSTNEEFHSVNEELYTVNAEYQAKIAELMELTADFNNLLQSTDIGVIFLDLSLNVRKFTNAATVVFNLTSSDIERPLKHITHHLDCSNLFDQLQQVLTTKQSLEQEVRLMTADSYLLMRIHPYYKERGAMDGLVITFVNIDDLKKTERRLSETLELLETTYETTPVGLALLDEDLRYVRINSALAEIDGLPIEAHIGQLVQDSVPDLADTLVPILLRVIETGKAITDIEISGKTPAAPDVIRHWIASYYPVGRGVGSVVTEVTSLKQAQAALAKNESLFRLTLDQSEIMVFTQDLDLIYRWVYNPISGFTESDFLDKMDADIFPSATIQKLTAVKRQVLTSQTRQIMQFELQTASGNRYFNFKFEPLFDLEGRLSGIAGAAYEVTQEKHAALALAFASEQAQEANQAKSNFLAAMSHELRTPLNAILGMTENLQEGIWGELNPQQRRALAAVEQSSNHLLSLINDILDISRVEAGQLESRFESVSVADLCNRSLVLVSQQAQKKQIRLELELAPGLPNLWGDNRRLRQVLVNLLDNAVKFTPQGGQVTLMADQDEEWICLRVLDTGIGIAAENIPRLFQPFTQIDSALNRQYDGTGLGLALAKQLVELHGGRISCTSTVGEGSCFMIQLPCVSVSLELQAVPAIKQESSSITVPEPQPQLSEEHPLVLLVEDNEANIETTTSYLTAKGYRMLVARHGEEALAMVRAERPNVILMDVQMPGMNGIEAICQIRQDADSTIRQIPIIALTALVMPGDRERCLNAGANQYLSKPIKLKILTATINQLLSTS